MKKYAYTQSISGLALERARDKETLVQFVLDTVDTGVKQAGFESPHEYLVSVTAVRLEEE